MVWDIRGPTKPKVVPFQPVVLPIDFTQLDGAGSLAISAPPYVRLNTSRVLHLRQG